ncbi:MAG TPA: Gfo/Idh/MocA family oxidoreductase [Armatimonadaceae bacterium]|nr:Gfo/Idh/MocA family oxidoreductase [Armatimonadaceae bacterium]
MKRIGMMGTGVIATYGHAPAIGQTPGLALVSAFDPNAGQLDRFCQQFPDVEGFTDAEKFFRSGIDAVAICSPAPCHLDNVRDAARYGKPVLCEKPLAMNDKDIATMISVMEEANLPLVTAFCYRFSPVAMQIKRMVDEGVIGEVRAMRLIYIWNLHGKYELLESGEKVESPRRIGRMLEGGPMVDCGVHQIDLARWWTGSEIVRYQAHGAWIDGDYESPDHVWLHMDHESGCHTAVEMSFSYGHTAVEPINHFSYHIIGTDGIIRYDRDGWKLEVRNSKGTYFPGGSEEKNFVGMYHAWAYALETGNLVNLPTGRDGLIVTRIARTATEDSIAARHSLQAFLMESGLK